MPTLMAFKMRLSKLTDLPEARQLVAKRIPIPSMASPSWPLLEATFKEHFLPIQNLFRKLKAEVLGRSESA